MGNRPDRPGSFGYKDSGVYDVWLPAGAHNALVNAQNLNATSAGDALTAVSSFNAARNPGGVGVNACIAAGATGTPSCVIEITGYNQFRELTTERLTVTEASSGTAATVAGDVAWIQITGMTLVSKTGVSGTTSLHVGYGLTVEDNASQLPCIGVPKKGLNDAAEIEYVVALDSSFGQAIGAPSSTYFTDGNRQNSTFRTTNNAVFDASAISLAKVFMDWNSVR